MFSVLSEEQSQFSRTDEKQSLMPHSSDHQPLAFAYTQTRGTEAAKRLPTHVITAEARTILSRVELVAGVARWLGLAGWPVVMTHPSPSRPSHM